MTSHARRSIVCESTPRSTPLIDMLKTITFQLTSIFALALTPAAPAQAPLSCACTLLLNNSYASNSLGSMSTNAVCTVTWPTPSTPRCDISGTIEIYYNEPPTGYSVIGAAWGFPDTSFSPIEHGHMTFDHPSGTGGPCSGPTYLYSYAGITVSNGTPSLDITLQIIKGWRCELD